MRMLVVAILLGLALLSVADQHANDAETWYQDQYAALWVENPWDKVDEIAGYYADVVTYHSGEEEATVHDSKQWIADAIQGWVAEDWVGSEVVGFRSVSVNPSTATFFTQWLDRYAGGEEERSCGWYVGVKQDGEWKLTDYADINCAEHGF